ncbi:MAG: putative peptidoglycan glycosyltransferase FtsW, partial [bacterium]|nr:putative peptidoglycan glycosyltransferase FtsW [bacterium]
LRTYGDQFYIFRMQALWAFLGFLAMGFFTLFDHRRLYRFSFFFMAVSLFLLVLVIIPGIGIGAKGASRWLGISAFVFQPSEITKLAMIIYLSGWFYQREQLPSFPFLIFCAILVGLMMAQPDMGTAFILLSSAIAVFFAAGAPIWVFLLILPLVGAGGMIFIAHSPYRLQRLLAFLNPNFDPGNASYHLNQILLAFGSGGLFGLGFGFSRQKFAYLPEAATDSIFPIIAEEFGFIAAAFLVLFFLFFIFRGFKIAVNAPDRFGFLLAFGITFWLGIQTFVNLGAMVVLFPLTGVPLPFISYGGSAIVTELAACGILLNISRFPARKKKK